MSGRGGRRCETTSCSFLLCCCRPVTSLRQLGSLKKSFQWIQAKRMLLEGESSAISENKQNPTDFLEQESGQVGPFIYGSINGLYSKPSEVYVDHPNTNPKTQYVFVKKIGHGGFGTVFLCKDKQTNKTVALKRIHGHPRNEIMVTKKLSHQSIIEYISSYSYENKTIMVMEYIPGKKVSEILKSENRGNIPILAEILISYISRQSLCALEYIHELKIIHLDIKADNIFINVLGNVKLFDFGLSVELKAKWCTSRYVRGTTNWLPPEVVHRRLYTTKCDIWSFGVTVLEMITGYPLNSTNFPINRYLMGFRNLIKIRIYGKRNLSDDICHFLNRCLTIPYEERPTATELLEENFITIFNELHLLQYVQHRIIKLVNK